MMVIIMKTLYKTKTTIPEGKQNYIQKKLKEKMMDGLKKERKLLKKQYVAKEKLKCT